MGREDDVALRQEEFTSLCDDVDIDRDRALVERCQAGDSGAYGNLYARYNERLLRFCFRRLNDRHEAEDAAQEAFARAWKALPNFAGERRFYPWLTVIAGNICTDMLRRRCRSTPTDDFELSLCQPVGSTGDVTCDELLIAAVDGELVHKALDRLSVRHRHVLDLREGSGLTYQQIADQEGVEIGTIETLLWRARQALKREFTVLSESKGALAGFLIGAGAFVRRGLLRVSPRHAALHTDTGAGSVRNAFAGVAVTSAAVAAAFVAPHAFSAGHAAATTPPAPTTRAAPAGGGASVPVTPSNGTTSNGAVPNATTSGASNSGPLDAALGTAASSAASTAVGVPVIGTSLGAPLGTVTLPARGQGLVPTLTAGVAGAGAQVPLLQPVTSAVPAVGATVQTVVPGLRGWLSTIAGAGSAPSGTSSSGTSSAAVPPPPAPGLPLTSPTSAAVQSPTGTLTGLG
jgi:RNA polymerase sigma-70 factor, ECF subfamily